MSEVPSDLKFSKDHEWVKVEGDRAVVGITDYAQETLGEIVFVELPEVGSFVTAGSEVATVESVKAASAIYNPLDGTIAEVNTDLEDAPESVNDTCYEAYIYALSDYDTAQYDDLLTAEEYEQYIGTLD
ncbi:MAG: glycine cleavage system protein GcvH [Sphaerochaetaceae bacterium]|nr:glycine cleavage system protein GcvH [Sphaerochaetaceae bacterium]